MHMQAITSLFQTSFFLLVGLLGVGFLIGFHELGHFFFCKLFDIKTPSFSIGMGPLLIKKQIGETNFALSAIPMGGYVEIAGLEEVGQGDQKEAKETHPRTFAAKPYWQKLAVMSGGILFNLIFAYLVIIFLYFVGMPPNPLLYPLNASTTINAIIQESPAAQSHQLAIGDKIVAINDKTVANAQELITIIQEHPSESIGLTVQRPSGTIENITLTLASKDAKDKKVGFLGTEFAIPPYGFFESIKLGIQGTNRIIGQIVNGLKGVFLGRQFNNLGGPILVIAQTIKGAEQGFKFFILLLAFISINLAILNIIPLPIFDGGQIAYFTIEAIFGRQLPTRAREYIHYVTWILLILLIIYLSIKDISRIWTYSR